ncbi:MAG: glycosyltransferase family 39 protein [Endomicrobiales bacterium]|nr:glycosyltransferase family 39 protein [Endomicrobiales bacterium]
MDIKKNKIYILLFLLISAFLTLTLWDLKHPISQYDEISFLSNTRTILSDGNEFATSPVLNLFGKLSLPFFCNYHVGIEHLIYIPFIKIFGLSHNAVRIAGAFFSILTILFTFLFIRSFFNEIIAILTVILLSLHTPFIMGTKFSILTGSLMQCVITAILYLLWIWYKKGNILYFFVACFLIGFGLNTRIWHIWFIIALSIYAIMNLKDFKRKISIPTKYLAMGFGLLILGAMPLLYFNLTNNFETVQYILSKIYKSNQSFSLSLYIDSLLESLNLFKALLKGKYLINHPVGRTFFSLFGNAFYPFALTAGLLWSFFALFYIKDAYSEKRKFIFIIFILIFIQTVVPCFDLYPHHFFVLYPFVQILIALFIYDLFTKFNKYVKIAALILFFSLFSADIIITTNIYYCARKMGYQGHESGVIYKLKKWLNKKNPKHIVPLEGNITNMLLFLSKDNTRITKIRFAEPKLSFDEFKKELKTSLESKDSFYIFYRNNEDSTYHKFLSEAAGKNGKKLKEIKVFWQPNGIPVYRVLKMVENT